MSGSPLRRVARSATAPFRGYLNDHFEMVKDEVRRVGAHQVAAPAPAPAPVEVDVSGSWVGFIELENSIAELSLYQGRILTRVTDEVAGLNDRIDELERIVRQLAEVVGASHAE